MHVVLPCVPLLFRRLILERFFVASRDEIFSYKKRPIVLFFCRFSSPTLLFTRTWRLGSGRDLKSELGHVPKKNPRQVCGERNKTKVYWENEVVSIPKKAVYSEQDCLAQIGPGKYIQQRIEGKRND